MTKKGFSSKGQILLQWIVNRKGVQGTIAAAGLWSLEQDLVARAGLDSWYKTGIRWIVGRWFRTGICWCRKVFTGPELVAAGVCWYRKVVVGSGLVVAGVCWCRKVVAGSGLVVAGVCWCRKVVADVCWCRKVIAGAGRQSLVLKRAVRLRGW